jgi:hypothetical protein
VRTLPPKSYFFFNPPSTQFLFCDDASSQGMRLVFKSTVESNPQAIGVFIFIFIQFRAHNQRTLIILTPTGVCFVRRIVPNGGVGSHKFGNKSFMLAHECCVTTILQRTIIRRIDYTVSCICLDFALEKIYMYLFMVACYWTFFLSLCPL